MAKAGRKNITFGVLADSHKVADRGKIDCFGIFDILNVWAIPARRECSIAFGLRDLPLGRHVLRFWARHTKERRIHLADAQIDVVEPLHSVIAAQRLPLPIDALGHHDIGMSFGELPSPRGTLWVPLLVGLNPWPQLPTGKDLERLLADPHAFKSARVVLVCNSCDAKFIFEAKLDPDAPLQKGARPFPENGVFQCSKCGALHPLKDVEGQVLAQFAKPVGGTAR